MSIRTALRSIAIESEPPCNDRIEPVPKQDFPHADYPRWIGHKFKPDGTVLPFPGNTVICHLPRQAPLYRSLLGFEEDVKQQDFANLFVFLPASSWHMTIFEGVSDQIRKRESWPGDLSLDCSLEACNDHVRKRMASFALPHRPPYRMCVAGWEALDDGIALKMTPKTQEEETGLQDLRDKIAGELAMQHPGHATYSFHISIAYSLRFLGLEDKTRITSYLDGWLLRLPRDVELGAPEYCTFHDMCAFKQVFYLGADQ
ncbi:uncharacterized protein Z520_11705 [Fonsecaea multimorphosa CBS 102226]|uniref:DUF1868 domain-containing protein n=1 Tax=Fonsecaea multimorphosa CBS 102226 TaxID=1442371 RepID=A0A0D2JPW1_9EURO|nr:uncharacterized protein Z520_11705 [Fonsecaea multimorphosa CBS 102226]KIX92529.1 hypothetical protein Z520_11705 [Fonsecaea multimorphosa CBS 102226]OAL17352.1 hypothetical protein AYO22_11719 [Fonsecaea multimorphosa]